MPPNPPTAQGPSAVLPAAQLSLAHLSLGLCLLPPALGFHEAGPVPQWLGCSPPQRASKHLQRNNASFSYSYFPSEIITIITTSSKAAHSPPNQFLLAGPLALESWCLWGTKVLILIRRTSVCGSRILFLHTWELPTVLPGQSSRKWKFSIHAMYRPQETFWSRY